MLVIIIRMNDEEYDSPHKSKVTGLQFHSKSVWTSNSLPLLIPLIAVVSCIFLILNDSLDSILGYSIIRYTLIALSTSVFGFYLVVIAFIWSIAGH